MPILSNFSQECQQGFIDPFVSDYGIDCSHCKACDMTWVNVIMKRNCTTKQHYYFLCSNTIARLIFSTMWIMNIINVKSVIVMKSKYICYCYVPFLKTKIQANDLLVILSDLGLSTRDRCMTPKWQFPLNPQGTSWNNRLTFRFDRYRPWWEWVFIKTSTKKKCLRYNVKKVIQKKSLWS